MPSLTLRKTSFLGDCVQKDPLFTRVHTNFSPRFHFLQKRGSVRKFCPEPVGEYIRGVDRGSRLQAPGSRLGAWGLGLGAPRSEPVDSQLVLGTVKSTRIGSSGVWSE
jgi:hypothetical protein